MIIFNNRIDSSDEFYWCRECVFGQTGDIYWEIHNIEDTPENRTYFSLKRNIIKFYNSMELAEDTRFEDIHMFYPHRYKYMLFHFRRNNQYEHSILN